MVFVHESKQTPPEPASAEAEATKRHVAAMRVSSPDAGRGVNDGARMITVEMPTFASKRDVVRP